MDSWRQWLATGLLAFVAPAWGGPFRNEVSSDDARSNAISIELLAIESSLYDVSPAVRDELSAAISAGLRAVRDSQGGPSDRQSALRALRAIHEAFKARGYAQPASELNWPNRIGRALTPAKGSLEFRHEPYKKKDGTEVRRSHYVDCDMAAQLFLSVADGMGWDMRIVNVPKHTYLRWTIDGGEVVNWDWTHEASLGDAFYVEQYEVPEASIQSGAYLRSLSRLEAKAYYKGLLGAYAKDKVRAQALLEEAITVLPSDPLTQNNYVWHYVSGAREHSPSPADLVRIANASLMWRPNDCNVAETLACAHGNAGDGLLGVKLLNENGCDVAYASSIEKLRVNGHCR